MKESSTYQMILQEGMAEGRSQGLSQGRLEEARKMLLLAGEGKPGKPSISATKAIAAIRSPTRLESLVRDIFAANSWDELRGKGH